MTGANTLTCWGIVGLVLAGTPAIADTINVPDPGSGIFTIQDGIDAAMPGDEVVVADGTYTGVRNRGLTLDIDITLRSAGGAAACTIDCEGMALGMTITKDATVMGFTLANGFTDYRGGAMFIEGADPTIQDCVFLDNVAGPGVAVLSGLGGAIWCDDADALIVDCAFQGNRAVTTNDDPGGLAGAVFFANGSDATLAGCAFVGNAAEGGAGIFGNAIGGALYVGASNDADLENPRFPSNVTIEDCSFCGNTGVISGGAMFVDGAAFGSSLPPSTLTMSDSDFDGNSAGNGGAMVVFGFAIASVDGCTFSNNVTTEADIGGGAVSAGFFNSATFTDCLFEGNHALGGVGGAVSGVAGSSHALIDCQFVGNTAVTTGGAVNNSAFFDFPSTMSLDGCLFVGNGTSGLGGAAFNAPGCSLTATNCDFQDNTAESPGAGGVQPFLGNGGALANQGAALLDGCTFSGNQAIANGDILSGTGGAVFVSSGSVTTVSGCSFDGNDALSAGVIGNGFGGAIATDLLNAGLASLTIENSSFTGNSASIAGGGLWLFGAHVIDVEGSSFSGNTAQSSAAIAFQTGTDVSVSGCDFVDNVCGETITFLFADAQEQIGGGAIGGGGGNSSLTVYGSSFRGNLSLSGRGGALSTFGPCTTTIDRCEFRGNEAALEGGAVVNHEAPALAALGPTGPGTMTMTNSLVACNVSGLMGGGVANLEGSTLSMVNVTVGQNSAGGVGGGLVNAGEFQPIDEEGNPVGDPIASSGTVANSILAGNDGAWKKATDQISDPVDGLSVTFSLVRKGWPGLGNIDKNPKWVDAHPNDCSNGDYHLRKSSPAIDTGDNAAVTTDLDLDGNPRIIDDGVDMGAYESDDDDGD